MLYQLFCDLVENQDLEVDEGFQRKVVVGPGIKNPVEDDPGDYYTIVECGDSEVWNQK